MNQVLLTHKTISLRLKNSIQKRHLELLFRSLSQTEDLLSNFVFWVSTMPMMLKYMIIASVGQRCLHIAHTDAFCPRCGKT